MKIEIGESLFYSWLRHVKECQIVQTNWKVSPEWVLSNSKKLNELMIALNNHYSHKYGYSIFKQNKSLSQLLRQGECDVLGISIPPNYLLESSTSESNLSNNRIVFYAVDVAFHEAGLNYGSRDETVMKVLEKCARTAFCLHGYLNSTNGEIIFASPKIGKNILKVLIPCIDEMNDIFHKSGYKFNVRLIFGSAFKTDVLDPIILVSNNVADTNELFIRSYQMWKMFSSTGTKPSTAFSAPLSRSSTSDPYNQLKVGQIARTVLARMLENGHATPQEIADMQTQSYSKQYFHLQYPLLLVASDPEKPIHYYSNPINIRGTNYYLCCEWFESAANNDRPYLISWIDSHL